MSTEPEVSRMLDEEEKQEEKSPKEVNPDLSEKESRKSDKIFLITVIIIIGLAAIFFFFRNAEIENDSITYNNFEFTFANGLWNTQWQKGQQLYNIRLHYHPGEVDSTIITGELDERFYQPQVYITHDPAEEGLAYVALATAEISLTLVNAFGMTPSAACTENITDACANRPIITCENTNASVIYIRNDPQAFVDLRGNCVVIQGNGTELIKVAEHAIYEWYGIID